MKPYFCTENAKTYVKKRNYPLCPCPGNGLGHRFCSKHQLETAILLRPGQGCNSLRPAHKPRSDGQYRHNAHAADGRHHCTQSALTAFLNISFTHHSVILRHAKSLDERKYYIQLAYDQRLKVDDLEEMMRSGVYDHRGELPNNFFKTIPDKRLALQTLKVLKDAYLLDYINVEDIDEMDPENVDESVIEKQIVMNIKNFIMNFGRAFTYRGHQVHYDKLGEDSWIDLLFYNRIIRSLVVIELKKGKFKPSYLGQLSAYLRILDAEEKLPDENPSVGIILCKKANKAFVEFVIQGYNNPMGVATYKTTVEQLKALLPPEEELKKLLPSDDEEL